MLLSLLFSYLSIANLFYEAGQEEVHMILFAVIFSCFHF
ncbi:conserved domain protein [Streptococcus oralis SK255]|uniref:Conserved domain protein n=1 Tax=Streptococcus oralis SK255 TaxID=1005704 RepID=F5VS87_STROR|nr:conserved domain protein [Streptococcus oralis SK255]